MMFFNSEIFTDFFGFTISKCLFMIFFSNIIETTEGFDFGEQKLKQDDFPTTVTAQISDNQTNRG